MRKIETLLKREASAREAAAGAKTIRDREVHLMRAERYADRAWILAEETPGHPHVPSDIWVHADRLAVH